ncbi:MAG: glycosyltransferase family A protein [Verrucomicrobiota bacterium]
MSKMANAPFISVVIPTCHRNDLLARCLALLHPDVLNLASEEYEVIVTDDGVNTTAERLLGDQFPYVHWTAGPKRGPAANRNHGAQMAQGEWVAFLDDDCIPSPGWLPALISRARGNSVDVIEGRTVIPNKQDRPLTHAVENHSGGVFWSCNLAVKRTFFHQIGGFDEDFLEAGGEDMEFGARIKRSGSIIFCADAVVNHPQYPIGLRRLLKSVMHSRWIILYQLKTKEGLDPAWPLHRCLARSLGTALLDHMRTTKQFSMGLTQAAWKTQVFYEMWKWLVFIPVLGVKLFWLWRFRRAMLARGNQ